MKEINLYTFDLESYLQDRDIEYATTGKNVSDGWTEVRCPFCDDNSMHLGISSERLINCWRCGTKGSVIKYIMVMENCSFHKAEQIVKQFLDDTLEHLRVDITERSVRTGKGSVLPKDVEPLSLQHYKYLESRGYNPLEIEKKYKLKALGKAHGDDKKYQFRIIIPMIVNGIIVNFTARDFTGKQHPKYINLSNDKAIIPIKDCVYNIDTVRDIALIVEGATDVWRMGNGTIATMGIEFTQSQVNLILKKKPKKIFTMFDSEPRAQKQAQKLAETLSGFSSVENIELESGDPGLLTQPEADNILRDLGIK